MSEAQLMTRAGFKRRQAAVICADGVGYSRLMSNDEETAYARLTERIELLSDIIEQHGGRTFGHVADSIMAEFARPIEAVQAAILVQRALRAANEGLPESERLPFRVGITVGDLIVDKERLVGDGDNIASRLQQIAEVGGIAGSEAVHDLVHSLIDAVWVPLGDLRLKNIEHPVAVYRLLDADPAAPPPRDLSRPVDTTLPVPGFAGRPAIAVLRFDASRAAEFDYLADSLAEDLITGLAAVRSFPVIDRGSSVAIGSISLDAGRVGRALGARYLVGGAIRELPDGVRITVNLVDSETGLLLWSAPFTRPRAALDALPGDIVSRSRRLGYRQAWHVAPEPPHAGGCGGGASTVRSGAAA